MNKLPKITSPTQHIKKSDIYFGSLFCEKPDVSFFVDASVKLKTVIGGYGIQNEEIKISFRREEKTSNNNLAELLAIHEGIKLAKELKQSHLEIFTDSLPAIENIRRYSNKQKISSIFTEVIKEIFESIQSFITYRIYWIPRHRNIFADIIAK